MTVLHEGFTNGASTTLTANVSAEATSIQVASASVAPLATEQYRLVIGNEKLLVTGGQGSTTLTVTRGAEGTTPTTHTSGDNVYQRLTKGALDALRSRADYHSGSLSATPTAAELTAILGTAGSRGAEYVALVQADDASATYLVGSDGTDWWYVAMTKAV